ncbi:MAG: FeoB-associated Cys-rich membrane protein [Lachnospiraceae bacterium]
MKWIDIVIGVLAIVVVIWNIIRVIQRHQSGRFGCGCSGNCNNCETKCNAKKNEKK